MVDHVEVRTRQFLQSFYESINDEFGNQDAQFFGQSHFAPPALIASTNTFYWMYGHMPQIHRQWNYRPTFYFEYQIMRVEDLRLLYELWKKVVYRQLARNLRYFTVYNLNISLWTPAGPGVVSRTVDNLFAMNAQIRHIENNFNDVRNNPNDLVDFDGSDIFINLDEITAMLDNQDDSIQVRIMITFNGDAISNNFEFTRGAERAIEDFVPFDLIIHTPPASPQQQSPPPSPPSSPQPVQQRRPINVIANQLRARRLQHIRRFRALNAQRRADRRRRQNRARRQQQIERTLVQAARRRFYARPRELPTTERYIRSRRTMRGFLEELYPRRKFTNLP